MSADRLDRSDSPRFRSAPLDWLRGVLSRTALAVRGTLSRPDGIVSFLFVTVVYLLSYLWTLRQFTFSGRGGVELFVVETPLATAFAQQSSFVFRPIARLEIGPILVLVSPVNIALGLGLAILVGCTIAVSVVSWRSPTACRLGASAGVTAGIPGLISGVACCGPQLLVVIGLQASAGVIAAVQWMVPIAVTLLIGSLLWVGNQVPVESL